MTAEEAIKVLEINKNVLFVFDKDPELYAAGLERHIMNKEAFALAIEALGKQIKKKPILKQKFINLIIGFCPTCAANGKEEGVNNQMLYCDKCGQAIDWGEA